MSMWQTQVTETFVRYASQPAICLTGAVAAITLVTLLRRRRSPLSHIPTIGSTSFLGYWQDSFKFLTKACDIVQEGYVKYKGKPFKVPTVAGWLVIVSGRQLTEEFFRFRDHELTGLEEFKEVFTHQRSFENDDEGHAYNVVILRQKLNRNIASIYDEMRDEMLMVYDDLLKLEGNEWTAVPLMSTVQQMVARSSNRVFVGLPLCRDPEWIRFNIDITMHVFMAAASIALFPKFLTPIVHLCINKVPKLMKHAEKQMIPIIEARRKKIAGDASSGSDNANDLVTWLLEGPQGARRNAADLTLDTMIINIAAIHTTSQAFTLALYNLATDPKYAQELREEVEPIIREEGWTKDAVSRMHKVDSFLRETRRMDGSGFTSTLRKTVKDLTLADGTIIPKGTFIAPAVQSIQLDSEYFEDAMIFDPWRFTKLRTGEQSDAIKYQFSSTSTEYLVFAHGRVACPGRFFASTMLSTMLAHVVMNYDIKLERDGVAGAGVAALVKDDTKILFRKRMV